jgi:hypothetical protein
MPKTTFALLVLMSVLAPTVATQTKGFSGRWASETTAGLSWTIEHAPDSVVLRVIVKDKELRSFRWMIDGPPVTVERAFATSTAQTTAKVDGEFLAFSGPIALPNAEPAVINESWKVDTADRLIVDTRVATKGTTFSRQQTFRRQP